jgi:hypothetical protein
VEAALDLFRGGIEINLLGNAVEINAIPSIGARNQSRHRGARESRSAGTAVASACGSAA